MNRRRMRIIFTWLAAVIMIYLAAYLFVRISGQHLTLELHFSQEYAAEEYEVRFSEPIVECISRESDAKTLRLKLHSLSPGKTYLEAEAPDGEMQLNVLYVHRDGVIAVNEYLGWSTGGSAFLYAGAASILLTLIPARADPVSDILSDRASADYRTAQRHRQFAAITHFNGRILLVGDPADRVLHVCFHHDQQPRADEA